MIGIISTLTRSRQSQELFNRIGGFSLNVMLFINVNAHLLGGHGHDFSRNLFFHLQCFREAFLMINQNLSISFRVISMIQSLQFFA